MGKVKQMGFEEAELIIDKMIEKVVQGFITEHEAFEMLRDDALVRSFFEETEIDSILNHEIDLFKDVDMAINEDEIIH